jgi:hypothetical protein
VKDTTSGPVSPAPRRGVADLDEARRRRAPKTRVEAPPSYRESGGRLCRVKHDGDGGETLVPLCSFTACIAEEVALDDGSGPPSIIYRVVGRPQDGSALPAIEVPAAEFGAMDWPAKHWGQRAHVYAGNGRRDHVRAAILAASAPQRRTLFAHTGWRGVDGKWVFLHAGGAVGAAGLETRMEGPLGYYRLPEGQAAASEETAEAVRSVLRLLDVAPPRVTWPLLAQAFLAPLCEPLRQAGCEPAFLLWLHGASGTRKTSLAAVIQALFGDFEAERLPATFHDTANALEAQAFRAKDVLLTVDDFRRELPDRRARERMEQTADALVRGQGNRAGRERMRADTTLRPGYAPRGLVLATGEDLPAGESTVGRLIALEVGKRDIDTERLGAAQAERGRLPVAMRAYLEWLRPQMDAGDLPHRLRAEWELRREEAQQDGHARLPAATAHLCLGATMLLRWADKHGALPEALEDMEIEAHRAILEAARLQAGHALEQDPARRFVACLQDLLETGAARVEGFAGPAAAATAGAPCLGELQGNVLYLVAGAAREAVNAALVRRGEAVLPSAKTLGRRLEEGDYLAETAEARDGGHVTVRRSIGRKRERRMALRWPPSDSG